MSHANAALTPRHRLKVARLVVQDGYPISEVAARFQCSWPTVKRWVDRYLAGDRAMQDRSSRPHTMPAKTPPVVVKRLVSVRYDADVVDWFKSQGRGWQARMNAVLRSFMEQSQRRG